jgi:peroxiredoxin
MKKILYSVMVAATLAATTACNETNPLIYSVKGNVPDSLNGQNVTLYACEIKDKKIATTVVENGTFEFSDTIESPLVARVAIEIGGKKEDCSCVLDEVPVVMNYDGKEFNVTGSRRTDAIVEYYNIREERNRNYRKSKEPSLLEILKSGKKFQFTEEEKREMEEVKVHNKMVDDTFLSNLEKFVIRNTDNVVGAYVFDYLYDGNGIEEEVTLQDSILAVAGKEFLETPMAQRTLAAKRQRIGQTYTDFELPDNDGKMHRLSNIVGEGKYVLLDIWASWCMGCRMETPHVKEAYAKYHDRGFEVVMVTIDADKEDWLKAMDKDGVKELGCQLFDPSSSIRNLYGISSIPCSMLIGPDGKIIDNDLRNDDLENNLSKLIGE